MTVIVAITTHRGVLIGADSFTSDDTSIRFDTQGKLWHAHNMAIGVAGNARALNVYRHGFTPPVHEPGVDLDTYMRFTYPAALRACLQAHVQFDVQGNGEDCGLEALIGYQGRIWELAPDFAVVGHALEYAAIGIGGPVARGALHALGQEGAPEDRLIRALEAAACFSPNVRGPFSMIGEPK